MKTPMKLLFPFLVIYVLIASCTPEKTPNNSIQEYPQTTRAQSVLKTQEGSEINGAIQFTRTPIGVRIEGEISGLTPNSGHGFHIHTKGECLGPDFKSAGGHFAPKNSEHGNPLEKNQHAGDLGNIYADDNGVAKIEVSNNNISLDQNSDSFIGNRSVVVHANKDDFESQPSGAAGARLACGEIQVITN